MKHTHRTGKRRARRGRRFPSPTAAVALLCALLCTSVLLTPAKTAARALEGSSGAVLPDAELRAAFRRLQELYLPVAVNRRLWDPKPSARADAELRLRRLAGSARGMRLAIAGMRELATTLAEEEPLLVASAMTDAEPPYIEWKRRHDELRIDGDRVGLERLRKTVAANLADAWEKKGDVARAMETIQDALAEGEWRYAPFGFAWEDAWFAHNAFTRLLHDARRGAGRKQAYALFERSRSDGADSRPRKDDAGYVGTPGPVKWPLQNARDTQRVSAKFLDRWYARTFKAPHLGADFVVNQGTQVRSMADGVVLLAHDGESEASYNYVLIVHADGLMSLYGHLSGVRAREGDIVMAGQLIGWSGGAQGTRGSGESTGAHLHFEVLRYGIRLDPVAFLTENATPPLRAGRRNL